MTSDSAQVIFVFKKSSGVKYSVEYIIKSKEIMFSELKIKESTYETEQRSAGNTLRKMSVTKFWSTRTT